MKDIIPKNDKVKCYHDGKVIDLKTCRKCRYYFFDGAIAALGEFTFTYDTIAEVQSPHVCTLETESTTINMPWSDEGRRE